MKQLAIIVLAAGILNHASAATSLTFDRDIQPVLEKYCLKCHGPEKPKGGINLAQFKSEATVHRDPKTWQTVLTQLHDRNMPPENKTQPTVTERDQLIEWVTHTLNNLDERYIPKDPGRLLIHRLSRLEYNNTVRYLLGVEGRPADKFPADGGGGGGFDNNADTLFIPPILMEKYLEAAEDIVDQARPERIFLVQPGLLSFKRATAKKILEVHATRAFRRPVQGDELDRLLGVYDAAIKSGKTHETSVKQSLVGILVSPNFLFRVELDQPGDRPYAVSDFELASRISYFLWSSMPDEELFRVARSGKLHDPAVLEFQVKRMLRDEKAREFYDSFSSQWLALRNLRTTAQPDPGKFPTYTESLRDAMYAETVEFFQALVRSNASLLELIDADYTFLNEELAKHYGIEGVTGPEMRRVALTDHNRGGVLGMGGVLTLTSYPLRTSPVLRGKWVLEEILGTPPPPPPPLVPTLSQDDKPKDGLTFRQRLEQHRQKPECAACHKRMDPIGFGLENFDPIGRWRTELGGEKVDSAGVMSTGEAFQGPAELKKIVLARKDDFVRNVTERMMAYSLGRGLEFYDAPAVKKITRALEKDNYRSATLIIEIAKSFPFQYRRNQPVRLTSNAP